MSSTSERAHALALPRPITVGWALKRAALGIAILVVAMGAVAWLTYASIEPEPGVASEPMAAKAGHLNQ
jgi:hypothetical protein